MQRTLNGGVFSEIPFNEGDAYHKKIRKILINKKMVPTGYIEPSSASIGPDCIFRHNGRDYNIEMKNDLSADYGQKMLGWSNKKGWYWAKDDNVTKFYIYIGLIDFLNKKNLKPIRFIKDKKSITFNDKRADQRAFKASYQVDSKILYDFYELENTFYIQIGKGYGFYSLKEDPAKLGAPKFDAKYWIRLRAKTITSDKNYKYAFYAVIKIKEKPQRSIFNIEDYPGQRFPGILP